jgi:toxin-antitoxin system PIN domain toxin
MVDFPDVNVWVALSSEDHVHHARADQYWRDEAGSRLAFCRVTALGLIRVIGRGHSVGVPALSPVDAWATYRRWRSQPETDLLPDPPGIEGLIERWTVAGLASPKNWTDLYLAAFSTAARLRLVTFDHDFAAFPGIDLLHLDATNDPS